MFRLAISLCTAASLGACAMARPVLGPRDVTQIGARQDVGRIDDLALRLKSTEAGTRRDAAWALGSVALNELAAALRPAIALHLRTALGGERDSDALEKNAIALGRAGAAADIDEVSRIAAHADAKVRQAVAEAALHATVRKVAWGKAMADAVTRLAGDADVETRHTSLIALARAKVSLSADVLRRALADGEADVRAAAAKLVGATRRDALAMLAPLLDDAEARVQVEAVRAIEHQQDGVAAVAKFVAALWVRLRSSDDELAGPRANVLIVALEVLSRKQAQVASHRGAIEEMFRRAPLSDARTAVARKRLVGSAGHGQLARFGGGVAAVAAHDRIYCLAALILDALDKRSTRLARCGTAGFPLWRRASLAADLAPLLPKGSTAVRDLLQPYLSSSDGRVRAAILPAVVQLSEDNARAIFLDALASPDPVVAAVAADTIAQQPPKYYIRRDLGMAVMAAARRHAKSDNVEALITLAKVLGQYRPGEVDAVLESLTRHSEPSVASVAIAALRLHGIKVSARFTRPASWLRLDVPATAHPRTAHVETSKGAIRLRLHSTEAPRTVANFVTLAKKGYFNGLDFHRVVPNFVVQGGDPRGDGWGGPGHTIPCERSDLRYTRGAVGMALAGKDTGGSQFFFTLSPQPHLNGRYTIFAYVIDGMDVLERIVVGDKILEITLVYE